MEMFTIQIAIRVFRKFGFGRLIDRQYGRRSDLSYLFHLSIGEISPLITASLSDDQKTEFPKKSIVSFLPGCWGKLSVSCSQHVITY